MYEATIDMCHYIIKFMRIRIAIFTTLFLSTSYAAGAQTCNAETHTGEATYYNLDVLGHCGLERQQGEILIGAMNNIDYNAAMACGACVQVTGPKGTIKIRIIDECPECKVGDIDLQEEAFAQIANLIDGRVKVTWKYTSCDLPGPISFRFKEGSSQWYNAIQVRDHLYPITQLEYKKKDGSYYNIPRTTYNYFVATEGIDEDKAVTGPYTFRVTNIYGEKIEETGIPFQEGKIIPGKNQFTPCLTTSVSDRFFLDVKVFYSPIDNAIILNGTPLLNQEIDLDLYTSSSVKILSKHCKVDNDVRLPLDNLPSGIYFLSIRQDNRVGMKKVLINR